jgi:RNA polymerase sigma-70 factor (ECF subfamily)
MTLPSDIPASDQDLVAWVREGDTDSFDRLVRRHHRPVYGLIVHLLHDPDLADDMTQDVFVKAYRELDSLRAEDSFSRWILRIANNHALDHLRREQSLMRRGLDTIPLEPTPDVSNPRNFTAGELRPIGWSTPTPTPRDMSALAPALDEALGQLKEKQRQCFILREIEERSYEDIAELLDLPTGSVGPYLTQARRELRAALGPLYDDLQASSFTPA